jgi:hypothetical protein
MATKNKPVPTKGLYVATVLSDPQGGTSDSAPANRVSTTPAISYDGVIFPVASRAAAAYNSGAFFSPDVRGLRLYINLTVVNGGTLTVKVQIFDPASQTWVDFPGATTTALAAVAVTTLTIYPGLAESANVDISDPFSVLWRVVATTATAAVTFGIGGEYLG